jgi:hypothetical protein
MKFARIATVQIVVDEKDDLRAIDGISEMLSGNNWVIDWQYLRIGGQQLDPKEVILRDDYEKGEAFI